MGAQSVSLGTQANTAGVVTVDVTSSTTAGTTVDIKDDATSAFDILMGVTGTTLKFSDTSFNLNNTVGGGTSNTIEITDDASFTDDQFANITSVQTLILGGTGAQNATLGVNAASSDLTSINATAGDASTIYFQGLAAGALNVSMGGGINTVKFDNESLLLGDTISGSGTNNLVVVDDASFDDNVFTHITNVGTLNLDGLGTQLVTIGLNAHSADVVNVHAESAGQTTLDITDSSFFVKLGGLSNTAIVSSSNLADQSIDGGSGTNTLEIGDDAILGDSAFREQSNFADLKFDGTGSQIVTLGSYANGLGLGTIDMTDATVTSTVDITGDVTSAFDIKLGSADTVLQFTNASFVLGSTFEGGSGSNTIQIKDNASFDDSVMFSSSYSIETLALLGTGDQTITLGTNAAQAGFVTIDATSATGLVSIDLTSDYRGVFVTATAASSVEVQMGTGDSDVQVLNAAIVGNTATIMGGSGSNTLTIADDASILDGSLNLISNVEALSLAGTGSQYITLGDQAHSTGIVSVNASSSTSGLTAQFYLAYDSTAVSVMGGSGDDVFIFTNSAFEPNQETIFGGGGTDTIELTDSYSSTDATVTDSAFTNVLEVRELKLDGTGVQHVTIGNLAHNAGISTVQVTDASNATVEIDAAYADPSFGPWDAFNIELGSGNDLVNLNNQALNLLEVYPAPYAPYLHTQTIDGGFGVNTIDVTDDASFTDTSFVNISNIANLVLSGTGAQSITLAADADATGINSITSLNDSNALIDISGMVNDVTVTTGSGADTVELGSGADSLSLGDGNNVVDTTVANLSSADTIVGGSEVTAHTTLDVSGDTISLSDTALANVSHVENLTLTQGLAPAGLYVTLGTNADAAGIHLVDVNTASNTVQIDAHAMTNDLTVSTNTGTESITTGSGNDQIVVDSATHLAGDTIDGGSGNNTLTLTQDASLADTALAHTHNVQDLLLSGTGSQNVTLGANSDSAHVQTVDASHSSGASTIDTSVTTGNLTVSAGTGHDTITTGSGDNNIHVNTADLLNNDTIVGGSGTNTLTLTHDATLADTTLSNVQNVDDLAFSGAGAQEVTLGSYSDAAGVHTLDVSASTGSTVDASATTVTELTILSGAGAQSISTGSGHDSVHLDAVENLSTATIHGGSATDTTVSITHDATLADSTFTTGDSNLHNLTLSGTGSQIVSIGTHADAAGVSHVDGTASQHDSTVTIDSSSNSSHFVATGSGNDSLTAGSGNDTLHGGAGADTMQAGTGHDVFQYSAASDSHGTNIDHILNWQATQDKLAFRTGTASSSGVLTSHAQVLVKTGGGYKLTNASKLNSTAVSHKLALWGGTKTVGGGVTGHSTMVFSAMSALRSTTYNFFEVTYTGAGHSNVFLRYHATSMSTLVASNKMTILVETAAAHTLQATDIVLV